MPDFKLQPTTDFSLDDIALEARANFEISAEIGGVPQLTVFALFEISAEIGGVPELSLGVGFEISAEIGGVPLLGEDPVDLPAVAFEAESNIGGVPVLGNDLIALSAVTFEIGSIIGGVPILGEDLTHLGRVRFELHSAVGGTPTMETAREVAARTGEVHTCDRTQVWAAFADPPEIGFYLNVLPPNPIEPTAYPSLTALGKLRRPLTDDGETANMTVQLDNVDGTILPMLNERVGQRMIIRGYDNDCQIITLFKGVIGEPSGDQDISITLTAESLLDPVPLRPSAAVAEASEFKPIPRAVGHGVSMTAQPMNTEGTEQRIGDAPIEAIEQVFDGEEEIPVDGWIADNRADETGRSIGAVLLADTPDNDINVIIRGERDQETGESVMNPADVIYYILSHIAGADFDRARLDEFRIQTIGVPLRGVVDGSSPDTKEQIREVVRSAGARFSPGMDKFAMTWPPQRSANDPIMGTLDALSGWDVVSEPIPRVDRLELNYAYNWHYGEYERSITIEAPTEIANSMALERRVRTVRAVSEEALKEKSITTEVIELPWLGDSKAAEVIGLRLAAYMASERWRVTWTTNRERAPMTTEPGEWWRFDGHSHCQLTGDWPLVEAEVDFSTGMLDLTAEGSVGTPPLVEVTQRSVRASAARRQFRLTRIAGSHLITILNESGSPLPGTAVIIDNRQFITDGAGAALVPGLIVGRTYDILAQPKNLVSIRAALTVTE